MQTLRVTLGSAWCHSAADVVAWREDVAWRRSVGLIVMPNSLCDVMLPS